MHHPHRRLHVRTEQDPGHRAQREPRHLLRDVDHAAGHHPPAVGEHPALLPDGLGVAVHPAPGEQRLDQPALAVVVAVLAGQQAVAEAGPQLVVEAVVLAEVGRLAAEHLVRALRREHRVELGAQPGRSGGEADDVAVVAAGVEVRAQRTPGQVEQRAHQRESGRPGYPGDGGGGAGGTGGAGGRGGQRHVPSSVVRLTGPASGRVPPPPTARPVGRAPVPSPT